VKPPLPHEIVISKEAKSNSKDEIRAEDSPLGRATVSLVRVVYISFGMNGPYQKLDKINHQSKTKS